jgi:hypothetical protein
MRRFPIRRARAALLLLPIAAVLFASSSAATPFAVDLAAPGDGLLTRDPDSGLEWLDIQEAWDLSYNEVVAELGSGGQFEGFRYATLAEFEALLGDAGVDTSPGADPLTNFAPIQDLIGLFGSTVVFDDGFQGVTSELYVAGVNIIFSFGGNGYYCFDCQAGTIDDVFGLDEPGQPYFGHFLVRAVPEPSTAMLMGLGLLGLCARRRKAH